MLATDRVWSVLLVAGLLCTAACASVGRAPEAMPKRFTGISLSLEGWAYEPVLVDRYGRRCGWTPKGRLDEVRECGCQPGWGDDDNPSPRPAGSDSATVAAWEEQRAQDSIYAASNPPPTSHFFSISDYHDPSIPVGLIDQGGCELLLEPISAGTVSLSLRADGSGFRSGRDTTSAVIVPRKSQRWRLTWKQAGDSCVVKITRLGERGATKSPGR